MVGRRIPESKKVVVGDIEEDPQDRYSIKYSEREDIIGIASQSVEGPHQVYVLPYNGKRLDLKTGLFFGIEGLEQAERYAHGIAVNQASAKGNLHALRVINETKRGKPKRKSPLEIASLQAG